MYGSRCSAQLVRISAAHTAARMEYTSVQRSLKDVASKVNEAARKVGTAEGGVRLVAVSKTKPASSVAEAYEIGHRFFGENYVQELIDKAQNLPSDIGWHFIGHLQSNKAKALVRSVPNLAMVETVDTEKLARRLDDASAESRQDPLPVMVQVNTSGEETKSGVEPGPQCVALARMIHEECNNLRLAGLMTIGMPDYSSRPENFECLKRCRKDVADSLGISESSLELSMGMSGDFEQAIEMGSTNVRVGSTIFGAREYK